MLACDAPCCFGVVGWPFVCLVVYFGIVLHEENFEHVSDACAKTSVNQSSS